MKNLKIETIRRRCRARYNRRRELGDNIQEAAHNALKYIDAELDAYGVEFTPVPDGFSCNHIVEGIEYINMGDTYEETILWDNMACKFYSMSWGDFLEWQHKRFKIYE